MTLADVCEPVFQYVCRLNRMARMGSKADFAVVRGEILALFGQMKSAAGGANLSAAYEKVELPLMFFVDSMIAESKQEFSDRWNKERLAYERNELAGDEKFYDLLDETLADASEAAAERLVIFYTCIGLGFTGWYAGQPEYLERKMKEIAVRIRKEVKTDDSGMICPQAYQNLDTRDLIEPPGHKLVGIAIALVGLILVLFLTNVILYQQASRDLSSALRTIISQG
ncbi:MAG: DotU family type IV/VI secretion system protein, partial [Kiritimatiellae bacterium]|nr:DotU family type IV/VI secretion system protein [Kiritimatiellia bacterium]